MKASKNLFASQVVTLFLSILVSAVSLISDLSAQTFQPEPKHPFFPQKGKADEKLLDEFTDQEWFDLIPKQSPRRNPDLTEFGEKNVALEKWGWNPHQPNQLTCRVTGEVYPSDKYPLKQTKVEVLSGKIVTIPFAVNRKHESVYVQAYIDFQKTHFLNGRLQFLGGAYAATGDERYARIIALVLDAWADYIPDYFIGKGSPGLPPISPQEAEHDRWFVCRVSTYNGVAHEWPRPALYAFDAIYDSQALKDFSAKRGYDVRAHIAHDFFGNIGDFFSKRMKPEWAIRSNLPGCYTDLANAATILNRPDYIEYLSDYMEAVFGNYCRDGMLPESFGYHRGYANANLDAILSMEKFFSIHPADNDHLRAIKAKLQQQAEFLRKCAQAQYPVCYPNGLLPPFGDTTAKIELARTNTHSAVLPAYGFVALGDGYGDKQVQLDLAFNEFNNHCQGDLLAFSLYAFGQEVLGNNRYNRGPARPYNNNTLSHSTVVIDCESQLRKRSDPRSTGGNLVLYEPGLGGIAAAEVDGNRVYQGKASRYQRLMILNSVDLNHPYVLDFFAVTGGKTQDYLVHGATTCSQKAELSFSTVPMNGSHPLLTADEQWQDPSLGAFPIYGMIVNARQGRSPGSWNATYQGSENNIGVKILVADDGTSQIILGQGPVLESVPETGDELLPDNPVPKTNSKAGGEMFSAFAKHLRPALLVRGESKDGTPLQSLFVSVIEPFKNTSAIAGIERLPLLGDNLDAVAVRIHFVNGRTDTVLVNMDDPSVAGCSGKLDTVVTRDQAYALQGRIGVNVVFENGRDQAVMIAGTQFKYGDASLTSERAVWKGKLAGIQSRKAGASSDAFITDADLPAGNELKGRWLSLKFGDYLVATGEKQSGISQQFQIDHIEKSGSQTVICLVGDPQLSMTGNIVTETTRPHRSFAGVCTFEIPLSKSSVTPNKAHE